MLYSNSVDPWIKGNQLSGLNHQLQIELKHSREGNNFKVEMLAPESVTVFNPNKAGKRVNFASSEVRSVNGNKKCCLLRSNTNHEHPELK